MGRLSDRVCALLAAARAFAVTLTGPPALYRRLTVTLRARLRREGKMTYTVVLIFVIGANLTSIQVGNKTYSKLEDCLAAATAATPPQQTEQHGGDTTSAGATAATETQTATEPR